MTLRFPYFHTTDVPAWVEALAVRDARIRELEDIVARQEELIAELERRLGLDSTNSSKPPSSDGLRNPRAPKRPNVKGRKVTTLLRSETPDHVEDHFPHSVPIAAPP